MSDQPKWALASKTILGALLTLAVTVLPMFGVTFTADDTALITTSIDQGLQLAGSVIAIWGRFSATQKVTLTGAN